MSEMGTRDRLVMGGLVVLGLLTVLAGIVTGRTTLRYVLEKDAESAAMSWTHIAEASIEAQKGLASHLLGQNIVVHRSTELTRNIKAAENAPKASPVTELADKTPRSGGLENFVLRWVRNKQNGKKQTFVSRLSGFAILDPSRKVLASGGDLTPQALSRALRNRDVRMALATALTSRKLVLSDDFNGSDGRPMAFAPITANGHVERVYAFHIDERAAADMTNVAMTVVSLATSLLIVMGFSIPAAIASRRIRERLKAEDRMRYLALHDSLTDLPNRAQLRQNLDRAIMRSKRHNKPMAVLCLDLDRFKDVNDTLGHPAGDELLKMVADRLRENVREVDMVGRLGGDEFAIVAEDLESPEDAVPLARRVCTALGETYHINGNDVVSSSSFGIAIGPDDGETGDELLKNADLALYRAKQDGRNTYRFFEPAMDAALQKRRRLENDLRLAIRNEQLGVEYQPQFDLQTGALTGYEALARWHHPQDGDIPPSIFLPLAEETGLIGPLGEWVLRTACTYANCWEGDIKLAVNLSPAQFKVQNVVALIRRILDETGFDPHRLELEITESLLLQNTESIVDTLETLDAMGIAITMDDFGTGYSSLSYLTRFPVSKIKIDRSFIDTLGSNGEANAIVNSIVGLGKSLHVTITAEGVETANQAEILKRWGCNQVQGFYYGMPESRVEVDPAERQRVRTSSLVA